MICYRDGREIGFKHTNKNDNFKDFMEIRGKNWNLDTIIILLYFSVEAKLEDKQRNLKIKKEVEKRIASIEEEVLIVLGDFSGHTGMLGYQTVNNNGRTVLAWIMNYNLILSNSDQNCTGTHTWTRGEQKSVIDYVLVNRKMYDYYKYILIDEEKEMFNISDHNLITINFATEMEECRFKKLGKWEMREFDKTDEQSLYQYVRALETKIMERNIDHINTLNEAIIEIANEVLKKTIERKLLKANQK